MNVTEMPMSNDEQAGKLKQEAKQHFDAIKKAAVLESTSSLKIGYHAFALKEKNLFGILGYRDEQECRDAAGVSRSGWFSVIKLAESFKGVSEELFCGMLLTNAFALADLPESKRLDETWVKYAASESIKDFAKRIDEEMNGKSRPSDGKERTTTMKIDMPASQKTVIEAKVKDFAEAHGMDASNVGAVLEAVIIEATEGETLTGAIAGAVQKLKEIKELCESGLSSDEILAKVILINEEIILSFATALEQAGQADEAA